MGSLTLESSRLEVLRRVFDSEDSAIDLEGFIQQGSREGWLNPRVDWKEAENLETLQELLRKELEREVHLGGTPTPAGQHLEIVELLAKAPRSTLGSFEFAGSGVRVAPRIVLTAAHVVFNGGAQKTRVEGDADGADYRDVVVSDSLDVAALVFDDLPETQSVIGIADASEITRCATYRSVGYGRMDETLATVFQKNHLDGVLIHSLCCDGPDEPERFGCVAEREIVAGSVNARAYLGDSGGGLLVKTADGWKLAGIVRTTGVEGAERVANYTRVDAFRDELNEKLEAKGHPTF